MPVRIVEVARKAGVSTATVDRVLHGRSGHSTKSAQKVHRAIEELGYVARRLRQVSRRPSKIRILLVLPKLKNEFLRAIQSLSANAVEARTDHDLDLATREFDADVPFSAMKALRDISSEDADAVWLCACDGTGIRDEVDRLTEEGVKVITIASDIPSSRRYAYLGLDNVAAGRTAGRMISHFASSETGKVGLITGTNQLRDHVERIMGISQVLAMHSPHLELLSPEEGFGLNALNQTITEKLLRAHKDLVAIYALAGGNRGVIKALYDSPRRHEVSVVVHQLDSDTREALIDGSVDLVLHQDNQRMMQLVLDTTLDALEGEVKPRKPIPINLIVSENLP